MLESELHDLGLSGLGVRVGDAWHEGSRSGGPPALAALQFWRFNHVGRTFGAVSATQSLSRVVYATQTSSRN